MFDVAVIGAGLAGCHAAATLARRGHHVLLLEAGKYPRPKVCGEFLSPECAALLAETGFLPALEALRPARIDEIRLTAPGGTMWRAQLPQPALGISRYVLDTALLCHAQQAGVTAHTSTSVTGITGSLRDSFTLTARGAAGVAGFQARAVLAAYGKHSPLDRALQRVFWQRARPYVALKRHFNGPPLPRRIDLHVFRGGYCGMSHVEDGSTNVCLLVRQDVFRAVMTGARGDTDHFIRWMCQQNRALGGWLAQAAPLADDWLSIGQVLLGAKTPLEGDILLVGDAAGMVAPLAGDGMAMALHSGRIAAGCLDDYLARRLSAQAVKQAYARAWRATFGARMRLGQALQTVMLRPVLLAAGLRLLNAVPPLGDFLVMQTRDLSLVERS